MAHRSAAEGYRVLVSAPYGRDAESVVGLLQAAGYDAVACPTLRDVAQHLDERIGAILLTEEALQHDLPVLKSALAEQPSWSDIPFVLLAAQQLGRTRSGEASRLELFDVVTNSVVLERPLGRASLFSAVASAMRSRQKQFETRNRMAELRDSKASVEAIANSIDQMIWRTLPDGYHDYYNDRWYEFTGVAVGSTDGEGWNDIFHADDRDRAWAQWTHSLSTGDSYEIEYRLRHRSGEYRWVLGRAQPLRNAANEIVRWFGTCTDIHDLVAAREVIARSQGELEQMVENRTAALEAEMESRTQAEAALRQSQKMEAVGQLTGGIAHDFNNMLTGVIGSIDIIKRRMAAGRTDDLGRFMDAASTSAMRAAALTARLLAFSRRQSLDPKPVDVVTLAQSLEDLLRRTIGELALHIEPQEPSIWAVADANQLENAILNLAINARDAMPDGGELTIELSKVDLDPSYAALRPDVKPGPYVMIAVSDTGVGMEPEILDKVFDPFFTTKPTGQGTGLGLSMVYGFARQSGGHVRLHSAPGEGTSVKIFLQLGNPPSEVSSTDLSATVAEGAGQTVLIVEDDTSVRLLIVEVLAELSYETIEAVDANTALPILQSEARIDLMISDVGLPGMNGRQLAELARQHRPDLPILFVTGYAENAAIRAGFLGTNMAMITKPFALNALGEKIADMLGRGDEGTGSLSRNPNA